MNNEKIFDPDKPAVKADIATINNGWKLRAFQWKNLPTAVWWGLKVKTFSPYRTVVEVPYTWRTTNPFKSIYFAALAGAAELTSGLIAGLIIRHTKRVSMLVTHVNIDYVKKANSTTTFVCDEGIKLIEGIETAIRTGEGIQVIVNSDGKRADGEVVVRFSLTWSFKKK